MKWAISLAVLIGISTVAVADEVVIEGLVYNETTILEWKGDSPPSPEEVGVSGVPVVLFGFGRNGGKERHHARETDPLGRVRFVLDLPEDVLERGGEGIRGASLYEGRLFPFGLSPGWTFRAPVYQTTTELDGIRILEDSILVDPQGDSWETAIVREQIRIVNEGTRAFVGRKPESSMTFALLATLHVPARPRGQAARLEGAGTELQAVVLGGSTIAILGAIPPTGPAGDSIVITFELPLGPTGGSISRSAYCEIERFRILYPGKGANLELPWGFSRSLKAAAEPGRAYVVAERSRIPAGETIEFLVSPGNGRAYWVLSVLFLVLLGSALLAHFAARKADAAARSGGVTDATSTLLARLDLARARGEIGPEAYAREREALLG